MKNPQNQHITAFDSPSIPLAFPRIDTPYIQRENMEFNGMKLESSLDPDPDTRIISFMIRPGNEKAIKDYNEDCLDFALEESIVERGWKWAEDKFALIERMAQVGQAVSRADQELISAACKLVLCESTRREMRKAFDLRREEFVSKVFSL